MGLFDIFRRRKPAVTASVSQSAPAPRRAPAPVDCPVCGGPAPFLDALDFNKTCEDGQSTVFTPSGRQIAYHLCGYCRFCFAPEMHAWTSEEFSRLVYNGDYVKADPEYASARPVRLAGMVGNLFDHYKHGLRHLDYGSGSGILSQKMQESGWASTAYDPFVNVDVDPGRLGQFDFITVFEVFEHVPDVHGLYDRLVSFLAPGGVILYSTMLSDHDVAAGRPLDWWYASPRNGHISLFSSLTISQMLALRDLRGLSLNNNYHLIYRDALPAWAQNALRPVMPGTNKK